MSVWCKEAQPVGKQEGIGASPFANTFICICTSFPYSEEKNKGACTYDVVVTQHVANVFWWVQVPLGALFRRVSKLSFALGARGSRFESWVGDISPISSTGRARIQSVQFYGSVAQRFIASACHAEDHGFDSRQSRFRHISKFISLWLLTRGRGFKSHSILLDRQLSLVERRTFLRVSSFYRKVV